MKKRTVGEQLSTKGDRNTTKDISKSTSGVKKSNLISTNSLWFYFCTLHAALVYQPL